MIFLKYHKKGLSADPAGSPFFIQMIRHPAMLSGGGAVS